MLKRVYIWNYIKTHLYILVAKLYYSNILFSIIYFAEHLYSVLYKKCISSLWTSFFITFHIFICFVEKQSFIVWIGRTLISGHNTAANFQTNIPVNRKKSLPLTSFQNIPPRISKRLMLRSVKLPFQISFACGWHAGSTLGVKLNSLHVAFSRRLQAVTWFLSSCIWVLSNIWHNEPWMKTHYCWSQQ